VRLDTRPAQWIGVALLLGWTLFLAEVLPRVAYALPDATATVAGQPLSIGGVSVTPPDGWGQAAGVDTLIVLRKGGAQLIAAPGAAATGDAVSSVQGFIDGLTSDPDADYQIVGPQPFTTVDGLEGSYAVGLLPQEFVLRAYVVDESLAYSLSGDGTDSDWTSLHDEILAMMKSFHIEEAAS
jgi:hypothetical protein